MENGLACMFIGHRYIPEEDQLFVEQQVQDLIVGLIGEGYTTFYCGSSTGFDMLCGKWVLKLKKIIPELRLILALPCRGKECVWGIQYRKIYTTFVERADDVIYIDQEYTNNCIKERNRYIVEHSDFCLCYLNQKNGATFETVQYARKKNLKVCNIAVRAQKLKKAEE